MNARWNRADNNRFTVQLPTPVTSESSIKSVNKKKKKGGGEGERGERREMDERSSLIYKNLINRCHGNMPVEGCFDD